MAGEKRNDLPEGPNVRDMPDHWDKSKMWERGWDTLKKMGGLGIAEDLDELAAFDPYLPHYVLQFQFGEVLARPNLDTRKRLLTAIAALLVNGDEAALESAIRAAIEQGVKKEEIVAVTLQTGCFSGFPKWALGARVGVKVFREKGLIPPKDKSDDSWRNPDFWDLSQEWEKGWKTRDAIAGGSDVRGSGPLQYLFAKHLPYYVIEFRFGAITSRPELDPQTRQLCTLATFLATGEQFASEGAMRGALNVGVPREEIVEVVLQTGTLCGFPKWAIGAWEGVDLFDQFGILETEED